MAEKNIKFGQRLDQHIQKAGLTKKILAEQIGVSPSTTGMYVNEGRIPEAPILLKISQVLNVTMEELLTGKKPISLARKFSGLALLIDVALKENNINLTIEKKHLLRESIFEEFADISYDKGTVFLRILIMAKLAQ